MDKFRSRLLPFATEEAPAITRNYRRLSLMVDKDYLKVPPAWESRAVLANVSRSSIEFNPTFVEPLEPSLWIELATEYDAEHFCEYLKSRVAAATLKLSSMFSDFERIWRRDELNHVHGFARVYSVLYSVDDEDLLIRLRNRRPDFCAIEPFLADEFAVCVALAFDEIATTRSYQYDMVHRYPKFGNQDLVDWIRLVARDEAWHFENALYIIRKNHARRIPDVPSFLARLVSYDSRREDYGATFVLDHSANDYTPEFLESCCAIIVRRLGLAVR